MTAPERFDVAIVGGGPAGLAAAERTLAAGLSTCIVDEQPRPGGQILRQPPAGFSVSGWMAGRTYARARALLRRVEANGALCWIGGASVAGVERVDGRFRLTLGADGLRVIEADRVLIAAGCYDMPVALPGWTLPGVMSAGGVQTLLKSQQVMPGQRLVLFGTHPLQLVLAEQLVRAGADVAAVCFAQPLGPSIKAVLAHLPRALLEPSPMLAAAAGLAVLRRAGVRVRFGAAVTALEPAPGGNRLGGVRLAHGEVVPCEVAAMCYGFLPQSDLPRQAGARVRWSEPAGGWETLCDAAMRSSVPGLYVAGETTGVTGADAALAEGALAGLAIAADSGAIPAARADRLMRGERARRQRLDGFIALLRRVADPSPWLPQAHRDTILCRCEDVSVGIVEATIATLAAQGCNFGASAVKLQCRAGMGLCQGRSCEHAVVRRIATARGCAPGEVSGFRPRFPARALPIADLLAPDLADG